MFPLGDRGVDVVVVEHEEQAHRGMRDPLIAIDKGMVTRQSDASGRSNRADGLRVAPFLG
jgi:hypothetical protein